MTHNICDIMCAFHGLRPQRCVCMSLRQTQSTCGSCRPNNIHWCNGLEARTHSEYATCRHITCGRTNDGTKRRCRLYVQQISDIRIQRYAIFLLPYAWGNSCLVSNRISPDTSTAIRTLRIRIYIARSH